MTAKEQFCKVFLLLLLYWTSIKKVACLLASAARSWGGLQHPALLPCTTWVPLCRSQIYF